ncbi:DMT family transporter [Candidatus Uabimicrobium sp. HlEnr_7]|uniref:DMT family transporter n=1 Tax=Candidatus Uabimicrobium helgolandensis TaxID=3095367 RepID=UPI0035569AE7
MIKKIAPFLIIFAALLWSLDGIIRRELRAIPAATLVMLEHCVGLLLLLPFIPRTIPKLQKIHYKEWMILFTVSIIGGVLGTCFYTIALAKVEFIQYTVVVLLQQTQPLFAIVLAHFILKENITKNYILLASVGVVAAYFLSFPDYMPKIKGNSQEIFAAVFALAAAVSWGSATVLSKLILTKVDVLTATIVRFMIVIPFSYLMGIIMGNYIPLTEIFDVVTYKQWLYLFGIACTAGAVAMSLYYKGLQYTPAQTSTILELVYPLSAVIIGYQFLNERLFWGQIIAGVVLLFVILKLAWIQIKNYENQKLS